MCVCVNVLILIWTHTFFLLLKGEVSRIIFSITLRRTQKSLQDPSEKCTTLGAFTESHIFLFISAEGVPAEENPESWRLQRLNFVLSWTYFFPLPEPWLGKKDGQKERKSIRSDRGWPKKTMLKLLQTVWEMAKAEEANVFIEQSRRGRKDIFLPVPLFHVCLMQCVRKN